MTKTYELPNEKMIMADIDEKHHTATVSVYALDDLVEAINKTGHWIPVSERLPEPNRLVLCYITTGATETYFLAFWNDIKNAWEEGIGGCRLLENDLGYEVIAWMPLPEPYKAERGGEE